MSRQTVVLDYPCHCSKRKKGVCARGVGGGGGGGQRERERERVREREGKLKYSVCQQ